jgi:hypothetical protein
MPYVVSNSRRPPKVSDFLYMPVEEYGGLSGPAKLRIPTGNEPNDDDEFEDPQHARALHLALKASGIAKVFCRYDGGSDEGFAWVDHAELGTGERLDTAALAIRLIANGVSVPRRMPWQKGWSDGQVVQEMLDFPLAVNWAATLLGGRSFGTGPWMYGAFVADLVEETITDDPKANPVVRNIAIEGVSRSRRDFHEAPISAGSPSVYKVGDRVVHTKLGGGTVTDVDGNRLTIAFDSGGEKRFIDSFVDRE